MTVPRHNFAAKSYRVCVLQALAKSTVEQDWDKLPAEAQEMYVKMAEGKSS